MQNWSNGYYLMYFTPFVPLFAIHRMWAVGTIRTARTWIGLIVAGAGTLILSLPFLLPYAEAQRHFGIERTFNEVELFAADVWSYATAPEALLVWGRVLRFAPGGESETFLGFTAMILALVAVASLIVKKNSESQARTSTVHAAVAWVLVIAAATQLVALVSLLLFGGFELNVFGVPIRARTPERLLLQFAVAAGLLLAISPKARDVLARAVREPLTFFVVATVLAMWLSLGLAPKSDGTLLSNFGIYNWLFDWVPGFNGLRAPARYAMIAGLFLAVVAGYGARSVFAIRHSFPVIAVLVLAEGIAVPIPTNLTWRMFQATPPSRIYPTRGPGASASERRSLGEGLPPVYARLSALPAGTVVTEFPFADAAWELRYVYYSTAHWHPITNGYSGGFPPGYRRRTARFSRIASEPDAAWQSLIESKTTHVVVHRNAFANAADADPVENWLKAHGARELERFADGDILFSVR
jgi:hypothetical protein